MKTAQAADKPHFYAGLQRSPRGGLHWERRRLRRRCYSRGAPALPVGALSGRRPVAHPGDLRIGLLLCFVLSFAFAGCNAKQRTPGKLDPDYARIVSEKLAMTRELAATATNPVPGEVWKFFDLIQRDDYRQATNLFERLRQQSMMNNNPASTPGFFTAMQQLFTGQASPSPASALNGRLWCPIHETLGIAECFHEWNDLKLLRRFGQDIIDSIPSNSIYFGGTDPGRFVITAMSQSHRDARPFYTLTQNALADGRYLDYLRYLYGSRIHIPTEADSQAAFNEYLKDAQQRLQSGQVRPGEDVRVVDNRVQVSGHVAVMQINGLLVKNIFDHNTNHQFYIEESFPLDWMYPYLCPHGLIFKLNPQPLSDLPESAVRDDRQYWGRYAGQLIGDWMTDDTSVKQVCDFAERVYLHKNLGAFSGDPAYVKSESAHKAFSKLRSSIAGLFAWRYQHADTPQEKTRMSTAADYAFRQAFALCPYSPEAVFRYVNFLLTENRQPDALLIAQTAVRLDPTNTQMAQLLEQLKRMH